MDKQLILLVLSEADIKFEVIVESGLPNEGVMGH